MKKLLWHLDHQLNHNIEWEASCKVCKDKFVHDSPLPMVRFLDIIISPFRKDRHE